jgi:hypothetical protein
MNYPDFPENSLGLPERKECLKLRTSFLRNHAYKLVVVGLETRYFNISVRWGN